MRPYLRIDDEISLHLARPELALPVFQAIDENRAHLRPWLPWVDGTRTIEDTKTFIHESMSHNRDGSRLITFIYFGEIMAGSLGVVHINKDHRKCEIGYWLREDIQGRGILSKALSVFIEYLFKNKGMNRIEVQVLVGNDRSKGVPLRLGFKQDGLLRQSVRLYDIFYDIELFSLLNEEWRLRQKV